MTAIAAPLLACRDKELAAYTSIPCLPTDGAPKNRVGNEWGQAQVTVQMAGANVQHIGVDAANYGVVQGIEDLLAIHAGPSHATSNHYWIKVVVDTASRSIAYWTDGQRDNFLGGEWFRTLGAS